MSHVRTETTQIREPQVDLLRQVAMHIAGTEPGGRVAASALDYGNRASVRSDIEVALYTNVLQRGVAVNANRKVEGKRVLTFEGDGYLVDAEYDRIKGRVSGEYLDAMLTRGFAQAQYTLTASEPNQKTGGRTLTFLGNDATKVFVQRDADGRLEWNFEGFSGQSCYDVQKVVSDFLKANGVETNTVSVTDKKDERWLEERLPTQQRETEN